MKIKTISYSESRETVDSFGKGKWRKYDTVAELEEGDNEDQCALAIKEKVNNWFIAAAPGEYMTVNAGFAGRVTAPEHLPLPEKNLAHEKIEIAIDNCTNLSELFSITAPDELKAHYLAKQIELSKHFKKPQPDIQDINHAI